ncbi:MAG: hypothetical protein [Circular genetic element sp.]|nr:MAG: hypothetical protein [Circular genetic element sp.]
MDTKYIACFFTLPESQFDDLEDTLLQYDIGKYLIGFEITPNKEKKEHFHILFEGTDQIYNNFSKRIVDRYGLRCKGRGKKKHGKVCKEFRDIEKMCSYTLKGGNFRHNGFPEDKIKEWFEKSFEKTAAREISKEIFNYLDEMIDYNKYKNEEYEIQYSQSSRTFYPSAQETKFLKDIKSTIIKFIINEEYAIGTPKPYINRHAHLWIQNTKKLSKSEKIKILSNLIID